MATKCCFEQRFGVMVIAYLDIIAGVFSLGYGCWNFGMFFQCIGDKSCNGFAYFFWIFSFMYGISGCIASTTSGVYLLLGAMKRDVSKTKNHLISSIIVIVLYFIYLFCFTVVLALGTFQDWNGHNSMALVFSYFIVIGSIIIKVNLFGCAYSFHLEMKDVQ